MAYGVIFLLLAASLGANAAYLGGAWWVLAWPALAFAVVAVAYLASAPALLGKRPDGRQAGWAVLLLFPYFLLTWLLWHLVSAVSRDTVCEVCHG
jgi:hypothetical protein